MKPFNFEFPRPSKRSIVSIAPDQDLKLGFGKTEVIGPYLSDIINPL